MNQKIVHSAIVEDIEGNCMRVRIVQTSACAACKVAAQCHASEKKEKIVDVYGVADAASYRRGDRVTVAASTGTGMRAVVLAFLIPFALMVGAVFAASRFTTDEPLMALAGLLCLVPYYVVLFLTRERLRRQFAFSIEK